MVHKSHIFLSLLLIMAVIIIAACQQNQEHQNESQSEAGITRLIETESDDVNPGQSILPHANIDERQFQLVGGSEFDVREPHPVSNNILQQKFPHTLVLHGDPGTNRVALTFDDGPDVRFTPQVLEVLARHDVHATFFLIGARANEHRDIVKRIHESGHAIGNHTYWHPNLPKEELDRLRWELTETEKTLTEILGFQPRLFRAPYGALNEGMMELLTELNFTVVGWDVDSLDWKQEGADVIGDNVLSNVGFGSIILMHDGGDWSMDLSGTVDALDEIITKLKADGTEFVTVPELAGVPEAK